MRLTHPAVFFMGVAAFLLFALLFIVLRLVGSLRSAWRRRKWNAERSARRSWERTSLALESARRVSEAGDYLFIVAHEAARGGYRAGGTRHRLRAILRVPPAAAPSFEDATTLPVRIAPHDGSVIVLDFSAFSADPAEAEALERDEFVRQGRPTWTRLPTAN